MSYNNEGIPIKPWCARHSKNARTFFLGTFCTKHLFHVFSCLLLLHKVILHQLQLVTERAGYFLGRSANNGNSVQVQVLSELLSNLEAHILCHLLARLFGLGGESSFSSSVGFGSNLFSQAKSCSKYVFLSKEACNQNTKTLCDN